MYNNFFNSRATKIMGLGLREGGISNGVSPIPGANPLFFIVASGTNSYSGTTPGTIGGYTAGLTLQVQFSNSNTGASTINVNGLGSVPLKKNGGTSNLANGDIIAGGIYNITYDGAQFQIVINTAL